MATTEQYNQNDPLFADIAVKLRDIEEKQNIIKDRVMLIGENLVSEKEQSDLEITKIKSQTMILSEEIKKIKLAIDRFIDDSENFARKNEVQILQRQFEMFQPMELARISDVEEMIKRALNKQ